MTDTALDFAAITHASRLGDVLAEHLAEFTAPAIERLRDAGYEAAPAALEALDRAVRSGTEGCLRELVAALDALLAQEPDGPGGGTR